MDGFFVGRCSACCRREWGRVMKENRSEYGKSGIAFKRKDHVEASNSNEPVTS